MCNILVLPAGASVHFEKLQNMVWNNPHGYGLIIVTDKKDTSQKKLEVIKKLPKNGTTPEEIRDLLDKYKEYDRFLHVRWMTEGEISKDNLHPFLVYDDKKGKKIWFMHNGTLYDYKPTVLAEYKDTRSDTKIFCDRFLSPFFENNNGNYETEMNQKIITKFWGVSGSNKGLLVSTDQPWMFINPSDWKKVKGIAVDAEGKDIEVHSSNDTYFDKLTRGYEFDRRKEEEEKAKRFQEAQSSTPYTHKPGATWPISKLKDVDLTPNKNLAKELSDVMADSDFYTDEGLAGLCNVTDDEFDTLAIKNPEIASSLLVYITSAFATLFSEHEKLLEEKQKLEDKNARASKLIANLKSGQVIIDGDGQEVSTYNKVG